MFCNNCGKELREDSKFCDSCGSKIVINKELQSNTSSEETKICCSHCNSKDVQKFEAIYLKETKSFSSIGTNISSNGVGLSQNTGNISSPLSHMVEIPKRESKGFSVGLLILASFSSIFSMIIEILSNLSYISIKEIIYYLLIGLGFSIFFAYMAYRKQRKVNDYNNNVYPKLLERWDKTWYCNTCGNSFFIEKNAM